MTYHVDYTRPNNSIGIPGDSRKPVVNWQPVSFAEHFPGTSRNGRSRHGHPAGHRARGRGARPGVCVHGRGCSARSSDGRFRDGGRCAGHRATAGPAPAPGNVHGPAPSLLPGTRRRRLRTAPDGRAPTSVVPGPQAAAQDYGHTDALAVGAELPAAVRGSQILGSQDRAGFRADGRRGADVDHDRG